jgi:hypothetical protein
MRDIDPIEGSQSIQALDRYRPLASLVGAEDRRPELRVRALLHFLQRPTPVTASRPQAVAQ